MATWFDGLAEYNEKPYDRAFWVQTRALINEVNSAIERARAENIVGGSLEAVVYIKPGNDVNRTFLETWESELRFPLIVSEAHITTTGDEIPGHHFEGDGYQIWVSKSSNVKCVRCWHQVASVGQSEQHPELCGRCITNVDGAGEKRRIA